ncbi:MAG TPA: cyclic nucleotide-binding domain-containing protein [Acetobacteraceae bacterium]|nr:cyclic nucleotide-binding domain-containing protein [Acetobacteraceae bacterium]
MIDWLTHWATAHYDPEVLSWRVLPGYLGALLIAASFVVRTMIPLRALSAGSNLCIIIYAYLDARYPILALNAALLPLNILRLVQMMKLVRRVRSATRGDQKMDWLKPYMTRRRCNSGQLLFRKGDVADTMFYIVSGSFRIPELQMEKVPGEFVGELGLVAPDRQRTASMECVEKGDLLAIHYDQVHELFFQNPDFGFYFMQLAAARLFNMVRLLEDELAKRHEEAEV